MDEEDTPAYRDGWHASKNGVDIEDNPYDEHRQTYSNRLWMSGWCGRFGAIKHGYDLGSREELY